MSVDVRVVHPAYASAALSIQAARDCYMGERAVKARADLYLPRLTAQKVEEYQAYKMRATFYSIVGRTVDALTGLAIQGEVVVKGNEETTKQMTDSPHGMQLFEATVGTVRELLLQGRYGILLDAPADAKTVGLYGYVSDSIINWDATADGKYNWVILAETTVVTDGNNPYKRKQEAQYRLLRLEQGVYVQEIYDKNSNFVQKIEPTFGGKSIDFIPFFTARPFGLDTGIDKSPMEDMVNINLSHYRTSADLEHGRHFCGLPTPVVTGADLVGRLRVGGSQAWVLPDKDAKAYYLEFKGEGLKSLEAALKEKEAQLSSLSSSVISRSIRGSESPDAIRMRMSSETASLFSVVKTVEALLTLVYNTKSEMEGNARDVSLQFPTQFVTGQLTSDEIKHYSEVYLSGGMPLADYIAILRRGGSLSADRTDEQVKADLEKMAEDKRKAEEAARKPQPQLK